MQTFDSFQLDCQDTTGDTTSSSLTRFKRWGNQGYHIVLADLGRPVTQRTQTASTVASQSNYTLPSDVLFIHTVKVTVGSIAYPVEEVPDQKTWDILKASLTGTSDIPQKFFVRPGFGVGGTELELLPTPASVNTITIIYESGDRDLNNDAFTTGTVTVANGDATITHSATGFTSAMVGRYFKANTDGVWYRIASFTSTAILELENVFEGTAGAGLAFTIAEAFNLPEDMQDLPLYFALFRFYEMRHNSEMALQYRALFEGGLRDGKRRWSTKTRSAVISGRRKYDVVNPNYPPSQFV